MRYISTRSGSYSMPSHQAVIQGLCPDGGLFVPEDLNIRIDLNRLKHASYQEIAETVIGAFFPDYSAEEIQNCVKGAYDTKFDDPEIVPVTPFSNGAIMELWHGPTSAFKDLALTILPHLLTTAYAKEARSDTVAILTATSGDTGKAALSGFADVAHTHITVFYPVNGVSDIQKRQMNTSRGSNVNVVAVEGNFDDCQRMVKTACADPAVKAACRGVTISSANSINIGRLVPQIVYYFSTYLKLVRTGQIQDGEPVTFVVPTGNFGDIFAGYLASRAGLPVKNLVVASNDNNVLTDFIRTGVYNRNRPFHETISPSMDILVSSNLERLLYFAADGDTALVASLMKQLNETGSYTVPEHLLNAIQSNFRAYWCDQDQCRSAITKLYESEHILIDPHTAVAVSALEQYRAEGNTEFAVVLSTASPYKFAGDVLSCISDEAQQDAFAAMKQLNALTGLAIPEGLAELESLPERFHTVIAEQDGISFIAEEMEELSK